MNASEENIFINDSSENTTETINSFYFYEVEQFAVLWILLVIIVAGNCGVLITLLLKGSRKSRMNYFITHLAFADLSVGLITVLTDLIWRMTVSWNAGNVACKLIKYLQVVVTYASTYVLVALSIDRYDAIRHPMKFSGSWKRARCLISTAWLFSVFLAIPILVFYEEKTVQDKVQCWIEFEEVWQWRLYMSLVAASLFVIPAAIIASCYVVIIITIWSKSATTFTKYKAKKHNGSIGSENSKRASSRGLIPKAKVKTVKITFVIVTVFILCWSPYIIFDLLQVFGYVPKTQTNVAIATLVQSLAPLNSAANPIIYCIFSTHFCRTLCGFPPFVWFRWKKAKRKGDSNDTNTKSSSLSEYLTNNTTHSHKSRFAQQSTTEIHAVSIHFRD